MIFKIAEGNCRKDSLHAMRLINAKYFPRALLQDLSIITEPKLRASRKSVYSTRYTTHLLEYKRDFPWTNNLETQGLEAFSQLWKASNKIDSITEAMEDFSSCLEKVKETVSYETSEEKNWFADLLKRIEAIALLFVGVSTASNISNLGSVVGLYAHSWHEGPLAPKIIQLISNILISDENLESQAANRSLAVQDLINKGVLTSTLESQADETSPDLTEDFSPDMIEEKLKKLRHIFGHWKEFKNCELAEKIVNVVNILVTSGFFPEIIENDAGDSLESLRVRHGEKYRTPKNLNFAPWGLHLFSVKAWDVQKQSVSFFDMLIDTVLFFLERGYAAFKHRDLSLLMHSDENMCMMDTEYAKLLTGARHVEIGNFPECNLFKDIAEYEYRLELLITNMTSAMKITTSPQVRAVFTNRMVVLRKIRAELMAYLRKSPIKEKPLGVLIFGASGIGKSTIMQLINKIVLHANGYPCGKEHVVTINGNDKFQSEIKSSHLAISIDDLCNKKIDWFTDSPLEILLQLLNNVPCAALSAIAEMKAQIWPKPKIVTVSTNIKHILAALFSNEPASMLRRFEIILDVRLKEEYKDPSTGILDSSKIGDEFIPDAWEIDVQFVRIIKTKGNGPDGYEFVNFPEGKGVSLEKALEIIVEYSKLFYAKQKKYVSKTEEFYDTQLCEHNYPVGKCSKCNTQVEKEVPVESLLDALPKWADRKIECKDRCSDTKLDLQSEYEDVDINNPFACDGDECMKTSWDTPTMVVIPDDEDAEDFPELLECEPEDEGVPEALTAGDPGYYDDDDDDVFEDCLPARDSVWMPPPPRGCVYVIEGNLADPMDKILADEKVKEGELVVVEGKYFVKDKNLESQAFESQAAFSIRNTLTDLAKSRSDLACTLYADNMNFIRQYADAEPEPEMHVLEEDLMSDPGTEYVSLKDVVRRWYEDRKVHALEYSKDVKMSLAEAWKTSYTSSTKRGYLAIGIPVAVIACLKIIKTVRAMRTPENLFVQGNTIAYPMPTEDDKPSSFNRPLPIKIPVSHNAASTAAGDLLRMAGAKVGFVNITNLTANTSISCDCFPMKGNTWLFPKHVFHRSVDHLLEVRVGPDKYVGHYFTQRISPQHIEDLPGDFVLVTMPQGGSQYDMSEFLPTDDWLFNERNLKISGHLVVRHADGSLSNIFAKATEKRRFQVNGGAISFEGLAYTCDQDVKKGYCSGPFIPAARVATLASFHLAGDKVYKNQGVGGILLKSDFDTAYAKLEDKGLVAHSASEFNPDLYGVKTGFPAQVHQEHAVRKLTEEDGITPCASIFGAHTMPTTTFRSSVKKSIVSKKVTEVMGIERTHGAPDPRDYRKHFVRDANLMSKTAGDFKPSILDAAEKDLTDKYLKFYDENPSVLETISPYPKAVILSGSDGVGSVDRINLSTSMGFPINKPKNQFIGEVDETYPNVSHPVDFNDPKYWERVEEMENTLAEGKRINIVYRANLKDEPVAFEKDKIRVFAGCEVAFTCLVRKYFLPILRTIQNNALAFECAVGVNPHSREWSSIARLITKFGKVHMVAGDYKAYDKRVKSEILMRAFRILIAIARKAGYTQRWLRIMRGIATEISTPIYEMDGVFIMFFGSNPSGHPLTVIINNIVNSLYMRYAYYDLYDGLPPKVFDAVIALVCYGDDNVCGVSEEEKRFNHTSVSRILAKCGIVYTMADKKSESRPFITLDEVDFLKRGFRWDESLQEWTAPLSLSSIGKSLHNFMKVKSAQITDAEVCAQALTSAQLEFFHYGEEEFRLREAQLRKVAENTPLEQFLNFHTYEELVAKFQRGMSMNHNVESTMIIDENLVNLS